MASVLLAASASALPLQSTPAGYATPEAALDDAAELPRRCLDQAGVNTCELVVFAWEAPDVPLWLSTWAEPSDDVACVDRTTADRRVACDAPDAVRVKVWELSSSSYLSPAEGLDRPPLAPSICLDKADRNICTLAFTVETDESDTLLWRPFWATADRDLICVEPVTYPEAVSCDAPGAVRYEVPRLRVGTPFIVKSN